MRRILRNSGKWIFPVIAALVTLLLVKCVLLIGYVPTESMEPTLKKGSFMIGCRIYSELQVGDVVIFRHSGKLLVKRIAAIGGDKIEKNGISMTVPEGSYYVLGDNTDHSYDSRYWSEPFIKRGDVVAKYYE